jgi:hypothetical protein
MNEEESIMHESQGDRSPESGRTKYSQEETIEQTEIVNQKSGIITLE